MTNTTYYNLNIVEGTDIVNPLTVDNPNYEKIDEAMQNNAVAGVTLATEIANATVHAITRENSDCAAIRFIATSRWKAGDTATVDGVPVTALLPSGETLPDGAYVINANVLCILTGTNLTVYLGSKKAENANEIRYNNTNVAAAITKINSDLPKSHINGDMAYEMLYFRWTGIVTAGQTVSLGSYESNVPSGKSFVSMFLTPIANQHISMSYIDGYVYAYSESYSGAFSYNVLMVVS